MVKRILNHWQLILSVILIIICVIPIRRYIYIGPMDTRNLIHQFLPWLPSVLLVVAVLVESSKDKAFWNKFFSPKFWIPFSFIFTVPLVGFGFYQDIISKDVSAIVHEYRGITHGVIGFTVALLYLNKKLPAYRAFMLSGFAMFMYIGLWEALFQPLFIAHNPFPETYWVSLRNTWFNYQFPYILACGVGFSLYAYLLDYKFKRMALFAIAGYIVCMLVWVSLGGWMEIIYDMEHAITKSHGFIYNMPWNSNTATQLFLSRFSKPFMMAFWLFIVLGYSAKTSTRLKEKS